MAHKTTRETKMRTKILNARKLILKSITISESVDNELVKNQFIRSAVYLKKIDFAIFQKMVGFEKMELSKEELIDFKRDINSIRLNLPMHSEDHTKELIKVNKGLCVSDLETMHNKPEWSIVQSDTWCKICFNNLSKEKTLNLYYLFRNIQQEERVRKAIRVLIKYTNRELDSRINAGSHLR